MSPADARRILSDELARSQDADRGHAISVALARIEAGEWGTCAACRAPIATDRLTEQPTATHCEGCDAVVLDELASGPWLVAPLTITQAPRSA